MSKTHYSYMNAMPIAITKHIKITLPYVYDGDANEETELEEDPELLALAFEEVDVDPESIVVVALDVPDVA
jgi:hypothetical protein